MDIITQENKPVAHLAFIVAEVSTFCLFEIFQIMKIRLSLLFMVSDGLLSWRFHEDTCDRSLSKFGSVWIETAYLYKFEL